MATLRDAINIARNEPSSERSINLMAAIHAGKMDDTAQQEGLDLSKFKQITTSKMATPPANNSPSQGGGIVGAGLDALGNAATMGLQGLAEKGQGVTNQQAAAGNQAQQQSTQQHLNIEKGIASSGLDQPSKDQLQTLPDEQKAQALGQVNDAMSAKPSQAAVGASKGIISTGLGIGELGARGLDAITKLAAPGFKSPDFQGMENTRQELTKSENSMQEAGKTAEQLGEFVAPMGIAGDATKAVETATEATKLPGVVKGALNLGAKAGAEGLTAGAVTAAQEGDINKNVATNAALGAAFPVVGKAAKAIVEPVLGALDKMGLQQISKLIKPSKDAYVFGKDPAQAIIDEKITANSYDQLVDKLGEKRQEIGQLIGDNIKKASETTPAKIDAMQIINKNIDKFKDEVTDPQAWKAFTDKVKQLTGVFKPDVASGELQQTSSKILKDLTQDDVWKLQQKVGEITQWSGVAYDKIVNQQLHSLYSDLGKAVEKEAPGTKELQKRYANILGAEKSATARQAVVNRNENLLTSLGGAGVSSVIAGSAGDKDPLHLAGSALFGSLLPVFVRSPAFRTRLSQFLSNEGVDSKIIQSIGKVSKVGESAVLSANSKNKSK